MQETYTSIEMTAQTTFIEKLLTGQEPPRCVDGRPATESPQGPQMLGGSLHPIVLSALWTGAELDTEFVSSSLLELKEAGILNGVHRGEHASGDLSDCGFADRMPEIIQTAIERRDLIVARLKETYEANKEKFPPLSFEDLISVAYKKIEDYSPEKIKIKGEKLVALAEKDNAATETVEEDHQEKIAFVNIKPNSTLDTAGLNKQASQGFNLDLLNAVNQASVLRVPQEFSTAASLILYLATEIVLVEDKGKPALPIFIHA